MGTTCNNQEVNCNFLRHVDYYLGIPICFLLSIISLIESSLSFKKIKRNLKPKKVLFIELSEMGSTILAYSAMKKAKELFNAQLYFLIFKENEESVKLLDIIPEKNIITIRIRSFFWFLVDTIKAIVKIRSERIDTVIDLELFSRFTSILGFLSGAKALVGFYRYHLEGLYRGNFQTHKIEYNPHYHISQGFMSLVYALNADVKEVPMLKQEINKDEIVLAKNISRTEDKNNLIRRLRQINPDFSGKSKIVLLNPNASQLLPIRKWPLQNFVSLAKRISKLNDVYIVITGKQEEGKDARSICDHVNNNKCIDFTGKTTLKDFVDLCNISKIIVTNDSGPAHFASLTGIKILVLFGPETPNIYSPLSKNCVCFYSNYACSPCVSAFNHRKTSCRDSKCLKAIRVDQVFDVVKRSL